MKNLFAVALSAFVVTAIGMSLLLAGRPACAQTPPAKQVPASPQPSAPQPVPAPQSPQQQPVPQPPGQQAQPQQQFQPSGAWSGLPKMQLERQFAGPLRDTIVQRWRDPIDGTICYLYLPISVTHSAVTASGFVDYGGSGVGNISCTPQPAAARR